MGTTDSAPEQMDDISRVRTALEDKSHVWKTLDSLVSTTGLSEGDVRQILKQIPDRVRRINDDYYTTRAHYNAYEHPWNKFLSFLAGRLL